MSADIIDCHTANIINKDISDNEYYSENAKTAPSTTTHHQPKYIHHHPPTVKIYPPPPNTF